MDNLIEGQKKELQELVVGVSKGHLWHVYMLNGGTELCGLFERDNDMAWMDEHVNIDSLGLFKATNQTTSSAYLLVNERDTIRWKVNTQWKSLTQQPASPNMLLKGKL